jgi:hypothetical protein
VARVDTGGGAIGALGCGFSISLAIAVFRPRPRIARLARAPDTPHSPPTAVCLRASPRVASHHRCVAVSGRPAISARASHSLRCPDSQAPALRRLARRTPGRHALGLPSREAARRRCRDRSSAARAAPPQARSRVRARNAGRSTGAAGSSGAHSGIRRRPYQEDGRGVVPRPSLPPIAGVVVSERAPTPERGDEGHNDALRRSLRARPRCIATSGSPLASERRSPSRGS